jgi:hypothetical protein
MWGLNIHPYLRARSYYRRQQSCGLPGVLLQVVDSVAVETLGAAGGDKVEALQQRLEFLRREEEAIRAELQRAEAASRAAALAEAAMKQAIHKVGPALSTTTNTTNNTSSSSFSSSAATHEGCHAHLAAQ